MIFFTSIYEKGFEAGVNAQRLSDREAQNHRLEDMLRRGKKIGYDEGYVDGYMKGHEVGYSEGEADYKAAQGIIELDGFADVSDDVSEALEEPAELSGGDK